jgi:hypothetical protein
MTTVEYKIRSMACPICQKKISAEWPRIGPAAVVCGHCGQIVRTSLPSWAELTIWQKIKVTLGELFVPRSHGEMGCFLGCVTWFLAPLCVIVPIGLLGMFIGPVGTLLSAENENPVWVIVMILLPWLFVPAFRTAMLVRKARASNSPLPPTWRA